MMNLPAKMKALNESAVATDGERAAIKAVIEQAQKILPGTRIRFAERGKDQFGTLLTVSLLSPNLNEPLNYELHAIVDHLEEYSGLTVLVSESKLPSEDKQLLKVRSFLSADEISADLKEPPHYSIFWRPAHEQVWGDGKWKKAFLLAFILVIVINGFYILFQMAEKNFPQIFGRELVGTKFERRIDLARVTVDDAIKEIDGEIHKLTLTEKQVQELKADKVLLEKARKDLGASDAVE